MGHKAEIARTASEDSLKDICPREIGIRLCQRRSTSAAATRIHIGGPEARRLTTAFLTGSQSRSFLSGRILQQQGRKDFFLPFGVLGLSEVQKDAHA